MKRGHLHKRGRIWHAVWHQDGRQRWQSTGLTNKGAAAEWLADRMAPLMAADKARALRAAADAAERYSAATAAGRLRLDDVWATFIDAPQRGDTSHATQQTQAYMWRRFITWAAPKPDTPATSITPTRAADYARDLRAGMGATTYNQHIIFMRHIWSVLSKAGHDLANPWKAIAAKRSPSNPRRELTVEEIIRLMDVAQGEWKTLIALGTYTGLRLSDCATLRWSEVDIGAGMIRRQPKKTARSSAKVVCVPIHSALLPHLTANRTDWRTPPGRYVLPAIASSITRNHNALHKHLAKLFDDAGIQRVADAVPSDRRRAPVEAGFHSLRHTFVTLCARANVPQAVVSEIVGHSSAAMTRIYTHTGDDAARRAIACLPSMTAESQTGQQTGPRPEPLPEWAAERLRLMTARTWRQIRDGILADAARATPATTPPTAPPAPAISTHAGIAPHATPAPQMPPAASRCGQTAADPLFFSA